MFTRFGPLVIALVAVIFGTMSGSLKTPLIIGLSYGFAALGLSILVRAGQVSFGHAGYSCVAGYAVAVAVRHWAHVDGLFLIFLGAAVGLAAGALVGLFMMRYRGIFFGMLNLAISMVLFSMLGKLYTITGGTDGLSFDRPRFFGVVLNRAQYENTLLILCAILVVAACYLVQRFYASPTGQAMRALKTNEVRLEYLGISAKSVFYKGYVLSAMLCGLAGGIFALVQGLVTPEMGYWISSGEYVFIAVLGGTASAVGAFVGAIAFTFLKLFAASILTGAWQFVMGAVLLLLIFVAPKGLVSAFARFGEKSKAATSGV